MSFQLVILANQDKGVNKKDVSVPRASFETVSTDLATSKFEFRRKERVAYAPKNKNTLETRIVSLDFQREAISNTHKMGGGMSDAFCSEEERSLRRDRGNTSLMLALQDRVECRAVDSLMTAQEQREDLWCFSSFDFFFETLEYQGHRVRPLGGISFFCLPNSCNISVESQKF